MNQVERNRGLHSARRSRVPTSCLINTKNAWPLIGHAKYGGMARHVVRPSSVGVT
jgi:hypothetical protein